MTVREEIESIVRQALARGAARRPALQVRSLEAPGEGPRGFRHQRGHRRGQGPAAPIRWISPSGWPAASGGAPRSSPRSRSPGRASSTSTVAAPVYLRKAPGDPGRRRTTGLRRERRSASGKLVQVEFVSANPTGPLNVVSARAAAVGDALVRLLARIGYDGRSEFYVNDAGNQVALLGPLARGAVPPVLGEPAEIPEGCYPGEYLVEVAAKVAELAAWADRCAESDRAAPARPGADEAPAGRGLPRTRGRRGSPGAMRRGHARRLLELQDFARARGARPRGLRSMSVSSRGARSAPGEISARLACVDEYRAGWRGLCAARTPAGGRGGRGAGAGFRGRARGEVFLGEVPGARLRLRQVRRRDDSRGPAGRRSSALRQAARGRARVRPVGEGVVAARPGRRRSPRS